MTFLKPTETLQQESDALSTEEDNMKYLCLNNAIDTRLRNKVYVRPHLSPSLRQEVKEIMETGIEPVTLLIKMANKGL